jgi:hypothetical protein
MDDQAILGMEYVFQKIDIISKPVMVWY